MNVLKNLEPGVMEIYMHPALAPDELKAITNSWKTRELEYQIFVNDGDIKNCIREQGIKLIGYKVLLELQRQN